MELWKYSNIRRTKNKFLSYFRKLRSSPFSILFVTLYINRLKLTYLVFFITVLCFNNAITENIHLIDAEKE